MLRKFFLASAAGMMIGLMADKPEQEPQNTTKPTESEATQPQPKRAYNVLTARSQLPDTVDFLFTTLEAPYICCISQPAETAFEYDEKGSGLLNEWHTFDNASLPECRDNQQRKDKLLIADRKSYRTIPHNGRYSLAVCFCDVMDDKNSPYQADPRGFCKSAIEQLKQKTGYQILVGCELRFYLVKNDGKSFDVVDKGNSFILDTDKSLQAFRQRALALLRKAGIGIEKWHHEIASGQFEISLQYTDPISMADQLILTKHLMSMLAKEDGMRAIFMPKPFADRDGSGLHIHWSLWDAEKNNVFYAEDGHHNLSIIAQQFLAGVMEHLADIDLVFNSTINSFKRLKAEFEEPVFIAYGTQNYGTALRIPAIFGKPNATRIELQCADPLNNPYVAFGALILAGLDGISRSLKPTEECTYNLFSMSTEEIDKLNIKRLPQTLQEAINQFSSSAFVKETFYEALREQLIELKRSELHHFENVITDWEIKQYA